MKLLPGKLNILIDGQFGSTGKGLVASYLGATEHIDISVSNASANAGHTFYLEGSKYITKMLPVTGILKSRNQIYFCPGAIIDPKILMREIKEFDIDPTRIVIHPRCAVITDKDRDGEREVHSSATKIASTQSGVGAALARKIQRSAKLAGDTIVLKNFINPYFRLQRYLDEGCTALMEVPQGLDLSISSGLSYPYCTSREITVSGAMSDAQVHPTYLGTVTVVIRTYPIRVGNIMQDGYEIGNSGPFYHDSIETSWEELNLEVEMTTVTGRIRRVATFSMTQYKNMIDMIRPDYVVLNFSNYMKEEGLKTLLEELPEVTHLGYGPEIKDIKLNHVLA